MLLRKIMTLNSVGDFCGNIWAKPELGYLVIITQGDGLRDARSLLLVSCSV